PRGGARSAPPCGERLNKLLFDLDGGELESVDGEAGPDIAAGVEGDEGVRAGAAVDGAGPGAGGGLDEDVAHAAAGDVLEAGVVEAAFGVGDVAGVGAGGVPGVGGGGAGGGVVAAAADEVFDVEEAAGGGGGLDAQVDGDGRGEGGVVEGIAEPA